MLHSILLLNTVEQELSYQIYEPYFEAPAIIEEKSFEIHGMHFSRSFGRPARIVRSWKNGFRKQFLPTCDTLSEEYKVNYSIGINIPDEKMPELLKYCDARDFEPYRDRKMDYYDEGRIGYRDEVDIYFTGITDSYIPMMVLPMEYYYDEEHIWPSEKLYRYLVKTFFPYGRKKVGLQPAYGASSLFI